MEQEKKTISIRISFGSDFFLKKKINVGNSCAGLEFITFDVLLHAKAVTKVKANRF